MCSDATLSSLMPFLDYASEQCCKWCQEDRRKCLHVVVSGYSSPIHRQTHPRTNTLSRPIYSNVATPPYMCHALIIEFLQCDKSMYVECAENYIQVLKILQCFSGDRRQTGTAVSASTQCLNFVVTTYTNATLTSACPYVSHTPGPTRQDLGF